MNISELNIGTMHSGKSQHMKREFNEEVNNEKQKSFYILPKAVSDVQNEIEVYGGEKFKTDGNIIEKSNEILNLLNKGTSVRIFLDEAQFLSKTEIALMEVISKKETFVGFKIAGLEKDYLDRDFSAIKYLKSCMDKKNIKRHTTFCECCKGEKAIHNSLFKNKKLVLTESENGVFNLETDDKPQYKILCHKCFQKELEKLKQEEKKTMEIKENRKIKMLI